MNGEFGKAVNRTSTGLVANGPCNILGFYVNSTSSGTIIFYDSPSAAANAVSGTITPAIGFHRFPVSMANGCWVAIGATLNVTIFSDG